MAADSNRFSTGSSLADQQLLGNLQIAGGMASVSGTTLDSIVSVNSSFTVAVFVGLTLTFSQTGRNPKAGADVPRNVLRYEVLSFAFFLFSSLAAYGLKLSHIVAARKRPMHAHGFVTVNKMVLVWGTLASALGSLAGSVCLVLSLAYVVILKLGALECGNIWAAASILPLVGLLGIGICFFISLVLHELLHS